MFITLEGIEGSGKTTIIQHLALFLKGNGKACIRTREPGDSSLGVALRGLLLNNSGQELSAMAELFLFLADRAQHVHEIIRPALNRGEIVLCDRYIDSTMAYQGHARGLDKAYIENLSYGNPDFPMPDHTLLLDLPVETGLERAQRRNKAKTCAVQESRFDNESLIFHESVRQAFLKLARKNPDRISVINAAQPQADVLNDCLSALRFK